jgi:hypothetical protein
MFLAGKCFWRENVGANSDFCYYGIEICNANLAILFLKQCFDKNAA